MHSGPSQLWWWVPQGGIPGALGRSAWAAVERADHVLLILADPCLRTEQWVDQVSQVGADLTVVRGCEPQHLQQAIAWHRTGGQASARIGLAAENSRLVLCVGSRSVCAAFQAAVLGLVVGGQASSSDQLRCALPSTRGLALVDFVDVMDRMMGPGGCPWVPQQTHRSLAPFVMEEVYELLEAIDEDNQQVLVEELGDVLLQVVFHACVAEQHSPQVTIDEVAAEIGAKMRRRRPHVFGTQTQRSNQEVATNVEATGAQWDAVKKAEKQRESCLDGIALALPALARAEKVTDRADRAGLLSQVYPDQVDCPSHHRDHAVAAGDELLLRVIELWQAGHDAETCLREAVRRAQGRVRAAEAAKAKNPDHK